MEDDIKGEKTDFSQKHRLSNKNRGKQLSILKPKWVGAGEEGGEAEKRNILLLVPKTNYLMNDCEK